MTVEAYLRAQVPGYPFEAAVIEHAAVSPLFARPEALCPLNTSEVVEDNADDGNWVKSLKYATSTLFYSAAGVFSGGSRSEQVGDVHASQSGFTITQSDREYYRKVADKLRGEIGAEIEENVNENAGAFDATGKRNRTSKNGCKWN